MAQRGIVYQLYRIAYIFWNRTELRTGSLGPIVISLFTVFSSTEPKTQDDHMSSVVVRRPLSVCLSSAPLNDFSIETPGPFFFKLHVNPSVKGDLKICMNCHGPLRWPPFPCIVKTFKIFFSRTKKASRLNLDVQNYWLKVYEVCSRLTFDLFLRQG